MASQSFIVKFADVSVRNEGRLRKIQGEMDVSNFLKILDNAQLDANPRDAKKGTLTDDIMETLEKTPELFHYKSKGLLLSSRYTELLERNRIRINIDDPDIEGILDGGHNTLAIALFLLERLEDAKNDIKKVKRWKELRDVWCKYGDLVKDLITGENLKFLVPIEILTTKDREECNSFVSDILDIAQARNNNAQLTEETKANKAGYYNELKRFLDKDLRDQIEWRTNDGGRIKARDLVAFSMIPLSLISEKLAGITINPIDIYSSKGKCVKAFNQIFESDKVSKEKSDGTLSAFNNRFISALKLTADIPAIYDMLLEELPDAYNAVSPGYGRIGAVKVYDPQKAKSSKEKGKYLRKRPVTKFSQKRISCESPDGFVLPLLWGLTSVIEDDGKTLTWAVKDPREFLKTSLTETMKLYWGSIKSSDYDPQKVGKNLSSYETPAFVCRHLLKR